MYPRYLHTEDLLGGAHGRLDVDALNLLPVLGEKVDEEVDGEDNVSSDLLRGHANVSNSNTEAERLLGLELELDGRLGLINLRGDIIVSVDDRGELTGLVKTRAEETGDKTNKGGRSKESVVLVSKVLNLLLVLVEELKVILGHGVNASSGSTVEVDLVTDDADGELGAGDVREDNGSGETLLLVGIVVLEANLELDGLEEVALLVGGSLKDVSDGLVEDVAGDLAVVGNNVEQKRKMARKKKSKHENMLIC